MIKVGICFSREFDPKINPISRIGIKLPVYLKLLELCQKEGWEVYVLTRKTYVGNGIFKGSWLFKGNGKFEGVVNPVRIDLVYDRSGGIKFPPEEDKDTIFVNNREFKILCWDKWKSYQEIGKFMSKTFLIDKKENLSEILSKIKTDWVVLKPVNGLKGIGIYIGPKKDAGRFKFDKNYPNYIAQEFIDTSAGIPKITKEKHDLRIVIVNAKPVWAHFRTPPEGSFEANVARGGTIKEVDYNIVPEKAKKIVEEVSKQFFKKYDNPIYSLDFGFQNGHPFLFEINDTIGFPRPDMYAKDNFLEELVKNFKSKLT